MKKAILIGIGAAGLLAVPALAEQSDAPVAPAHHVYHHVRHHVYGATPEQAAIPPMARAQIYPAPVVAPLNQGPEFDCQRTGCGFEPNGWHGEND